MSILLTIAAGFIILGFILFQVFLKKWELFSSEMLIEFGYAIFDIFMWGLVGMIAYVYNKASIVAFYTMSFNVFGIVTGFVISIFLEFEQSGEGITAVLISLICAVFGMMIISIIYKETVFDIVKGLEILTIENKRQENFQKQSAYKLLSNREKEVFELLISNIKNKTIAEQLFITENTIKKHAKNIYAKFNVKNKRELRQIFVKKKK